MARHLTLLTLALVTATQTAEAFPHYTDFGGRRLQATRAKSRNSIYDAAGNDASHVALNETIESVLEMHLDDDAMLEAMLVLIAMEEAFNQGDGSSMTLETPLDVREFSMMLNLLAIEAEKSAAWIDRSIPPHRNRH